MEEFENDVATVVKQKIKRPSKYNVIYHNDDYTPMDFVVDTLMEFFNHDIKTAMAIMLDVHNNDSAVAGTYIKEIATEKVIEVLKLAHKLDLPLVVSTEPEG